MDTATPRTEHVLQHGIHYTGKDDLVFLCRQLERELIASAERRARLEDASLTARDEGIEAAAQHVEGFNRGMAVVIRALKGQP